MNLNKFTIFAITLLTLLVAAACNRIQTPSTPAVTYPYTLDVLAPMEFVLVERGDEIVFEANCVESGTWQSIQIDLQTTELDNESSIDAGDVGACVGGEEAIFSSFLWRNGELDQGEMVSLLINFAASDTTATSVTHTFEVGEDGRIHPIE